MKKCMISWLCVLLSFGMLGCGHHETVDNPPPKDLIPEDSIVDLMAEQLLVESAFDFAKQGVERDDITLYSQINQVVSNEPVNPDTLSQGSMCAMLKLCRDHYTTWFKEKKLDPKRYERSLRYYFSRAESTEKVMQKVKNKLTVIAPKTPPEPVKYADQSYPY